MADEIKFDAVDGYFNNHKDKVVALAVGWITFRLRGPYFVLASIAVAEVIRLLALNWKDLTNGAEGILASDIPPLRLGGTVLTDWNSKTPYYYMGLVMAAFCVAVNLVVKRSKLGYYLQAIREDQDAAHSLGIPLTLLGQIDNLLCQDCTGAFRMTVDLEGAFVGLDYPPRII